jgi:phage FluMu protein gp41
LLAPIAGTNLRVLCIGGGDVFPAELNAERIAAVSSGEPVWYPYAAGSFGVEMML